MVVEVIGGKKTEEDPTSSRQSLNNRPYVITIEYAIDPEKKVLYGLLRKGYLESSTTSKAKNPYL